MNDKKIIVTAVILSLLLIGGAWYYSNQSPAASISGSVASPSAAAVSAKGITIGDPNAPVTMEEYTNFLCPACANFAVSTLQSIKEDYIKKGQVKMVFYIFPPYELGRAVLCAEEQNKFIEFHDYLFAHASQITKEDDLKDMAINAGLDISKFNACYASDKYNDTVAKWAEEGSSRGVSATPTFFINGQKLIGAQPYGDFKKIIDEKIKQAQ